MDVSKTLMCLILLLCALCAKAKEGPPDQQSIDSLLYEIDRITARNYAAALHFIDSTLLVTQEKPALATQYLYVKMKKSSVLLKAKAYSDALQNLLEIESDVNNQPDLLMKGFYQAMMAFIYGDQSDFSKAILYYNQALDFYETAGNTGKLLLHEII